MNINTHQKIDQTLCGHPVFLEENKCSIEFKAIESMAADNSGLVHGGFIFGLADYAAMLAVNHPNVVLGGAQVKFLKPSKVGDVLVAEAQVTSSEGKKRIVSVKVSKENDVVFEGELICFVPPKHVLQP
ncbi:MAG: PaaI family thioesterase [Desulfobacteraceae bacterium]